MSYLELFLYVQKPQNHADSSIFWVGVDTKFPQQRVGALTKLSIN
jgi:hypothetical protein